MDPLLTTQSFQAYLLAGERIIWTGHPKQGVALSGRDTFLIPFSLMWGGFAIFWNVGVWVGIGGNNEAAPWFLRLWGLPFLVVGLYLIFGRFLHDAYLRKHLRYAITDQRVLVLRKSKLTSLDVRRLPRLELSEHADQTGTLSFEATGFNLWGGMNGLNWWVPSLGGSAQFFRIEKSRQVYEIIQKQIQS